MSPKKFVVVASLAVVVAIGATLAAVSVGFAQSQRRTIDRVVSLHAPDESTIPEGPVGAAVRFGKKVLTDTQTYARVYVGNGLNCSSCHLDAGRRAYASPWVGLWGVFPEYRSRNGQINALQDRINDCFERSMNGNPCRTRAMKCAESWRTSGGFREMSRRVSPSRGAGSCSVDLVGPQILSEASRSTS